MVLDELKLDGWRAGFLRRNRMRAAVSASASMHEGHLEVESDERAGHQEQEPPSPQQEPFK